MRKIKEEKGYDMIFFSVVDIYRAQEANTHISSVFLASEVTFIFFSFSFLYLLFICFSFFFLFSSIRFIYIFFLTHHFLSLFDFID